MSYQRKLNRTQYHQRPRVFSPWISWALVLMLLAVGCAPPQTTDPETDVTALTETPIPEKTRLVYGVGAEPVSLDPGNAIDGGSNEVMRNIYDFLIRLNEDWTYEPALATEWTVSSDERTWTLTLREGVKFHDGSDFDANAVKFNIERVLDEANGLSTTGQWTPYIESVEVLDTHTVAIITKEPYGSFLDLMARFSLMISPQAIEHYGNDIERNPVGTGPFMLDSWLSGQRLTLVRNPDYWADGPSVDEVEYRFLREDSARVLALEAGDINMANRIPAATISDIIAHPDLSVERVTTVNLFYWAFNNNKEPWQDPRVRQALNYAIDRESLVHRVLFDMGVPAVGFVPPTIPGAMPLEYTYDPDKARQLLEEAGYPFDYRATAYVTEGRYYGDRQIAEAIQGMLADVGVIVDLEVIEWGAFVDAVWFSPPDSPSAQERDFVQTAFGRTDPATWGNQVLHCDAWPTTAFNEAFYCNREASDIIDQMNTTTDPETARELLLQLQRILAEDPPWIFSHWEQTALAHHNSVQDFWIHPLGNTMLDRVKMGD